MCTHCNYFPIAFFLSAVDRYPLCGLIYRFSISIEEELILWSFPFYSPNKSKIRNKEDLINYLELEGTCKCGLECPLKVDETFNFDPKIPSKFNPATLVKEDIKCKTHQKFTEQFPPTTKIKLDRRGRKPGE